MTEEVVQDKGTFSIHVLVLIVYAVLIALFYSPVIFGGKSLLPALYQPHGVTAGGVYGEKGRTPANTFNVDIATPAYYEFPVNKLVGQMYRDGHAPLWNPYQGGGTPLAAQYSTRAFFPYQIAEDLSPVLTWDYFLLGRLLIAGFFTYLFISALGAGTWSAFAGGLFYMFSGVFTWFINLEQLVNVAMTLPLLLLSLELLSRGSPGARWVKVKIVFSAICFALILLGGQPETALYCLALAALFYIFRALTRHGLGEGIKTLPRGAIAFVTGLALSSPLILLFLELVDRGAHIHHAGGRMGTESLIHWRSLFNILTPTLSYFPANTDTIHGTSLLVKFGENFFRFMPINGVWDTLGGYTGVLPLFLIISGIFISPLRKRIPMRKEFFFFLLVAAFLLMKNAGIWPFILIGKAPLFDRVWTLRWAGPVWVFCVAVAGGLGLSMIETHMGLFGDETLSNKKPPLIPRGVVFIFCAGIIGGLYIIYSFVPSISMFVHRADVFNEAMRAFVFPSIISGSLVTLIIIAAAFCVTYFWKDEKNIYALIVLAVVELWWAVPRGYAPESLTMKWVPLGVGLLGVSFFFRNKIAFAFLALAVFFASAFLLDTIAPNGYPPRDDPFATAPYVAAIVKDSGQDRPRVAGAYGVLFPNFAGVVGLDDIRYVNSVAPEEFQAFREKYLHSQTTGELKEASLWFIGRPEQIMKKIEKGSHLYLRTDNPPENYFMESLRGYSMLGVGYFIFPANGRYGGADEDVKKAFEEKFPLVYSGQDALVYKNPSALPRVFLASNTVKASSWEAAQKAFMEGEFDPSETIVVEEDIVEASSKVSSGRGIVASLFTPASAEAAPLTVSAAPSVVDKASETPAKDTDALPEKIPAIHPETAIDISTKTVPDAAAKKANKEITPPAPDVPSKKAPVEVIDTTVPDMAPASSSEDDSNGAIVPSTEAAPEVPAGAQAPEEAVGKAGAETIGSAGEALDGGETKPLEEQIPESGADAVLPVGPANKPGAFITEYKPGRVIVEVNSDKDAVLVLGDVYYPGWKVKVNGEKAKLLRVNGLVRGVPVKEGKSSVVFYYRPLNFILGLVIMAIAGIFCLVLIFKDVRGG